MPKTASQMVNILAAGGGLIVDAGPLTLDQLVQMAGATQAKRSILILRNADFKTEAQLVEIGAAGPGRVIFDL